MLWDSPTKAMVHVRLPLTNYCASAKRLDCLHEERILPCIFSSSERESSHVSGTVLRKDIPEEFSRDPPSVTSDLGP
jgi:hypothetical protein